MSEAEIEDNTINMVHTLHKILKPFLLRRIKSEVERDIPAKREILVRVALTPL